jgi:hypothetical protein
MPPDAIWEPKRIIAIPSPWAAEFRLLVFPTGAMDVLTAVITAEGEFTMTTPNAEEQSLQAAPAREPEATKTPHTAPRKPRVAPQQGQVGNEAQKRAIKPKGAKPAKSADGGRAGSKAAKVLELLKRPGGTTLKELESTGWQPHSVRGFLSGTIGKKMGLSLASTKGEGERTYSLES